VLTRDHICSFTCHPSVYPQVAWNIPSFTPQPQNTTHFGRYSFCRPTKGRRLSQRHLLRRRYVDSDLTVALAPDNPQCTATVLVDHYLWYVSSALSINLVLFWKQMHKITETQTQTQNPCRLHNIYIQNKSSSALSTEIDRSTAHHIGLTDNFTSPQFLWSWVFAQFLWRKYFILSYNRVSLSRRRPQNNHHFVKSYHSNARQEAQLSERDHLMHWPQRTHGLRLHLGLSPLIFYTVSGKNGTTLFLPITLPNANRFRKFFHRQT